MHIKEILGKYCILTGWTVIHGINKQQQKNNLNTQNRNFTTKPPHKIYYRHAKLNIDKQQNKQANQWLMPL